MHDPKSLANLASASHRICRLIIALFGVAFLGSSFAAAPKNVIVYPVEDTLGFRAIVEQARKEWVALEQQHGHELDLRGVHMHYLEWGDSKGVPFIWSPGFTNSAVDFMELGPQLAGAGYHVFSLSHRAHGLSQVSDTNFTIYTLADDTAELMDKLHIPCAVLAGTSFGAWITAAFYDGHKERTLGLVLGAGGSYMWQSRLEVVAHSIMEEYGKLTGPILPSWSFDNPVDAIRAIMNDLLPDLGGEVPDSVVPLFWSLIKQGPDGKWLRATPVEALGAVYPDWIDPAAGYRMTPLQRSIRALNPETIFRQLDVPMLIIEAVGHQTTDLETNSDRRLQAAFPSLVTWSVYKDTEHAFTKIHPDWVLRDLIAELKRVKEHPNLHCNRP